MLSLNIWSRNEISSVFMITNCGLTEKYKTDSIQLSVFNEGSILSFLTMSWSHISLGVFTLLFITFFFLIVFHQIVRQKLYWVLNMWCKVSPVWCWQPWSWQSWHDWVYHKTLTWFATDFQSKRPSLNSLNTLLKRGYCDHAARQNLLAILRNFPLGQKVLVVIFITQTSIYKPPVAVCWQQIRQEGGGGPLAERNAVQSHEEAWGYQYCQIYKQEHENELNIK